MKPDDIEQRVCERSESRTLRKPNPKAVKPLPMNLIREALELEPTSPTHLRWRVRPRSQFNRDQDWSGWNTRYAGTVAGCEAADGHGRKYFTVGINNMLYASHRIVYALAFGIDAGNLHIDHIDNNGQNNNPSNLRLSTHTENMRNRGKYRNNTSGRKGVNWCNRARKWRSKIKINGRTRNLGCFTSLDDAAAAYESAARQYHGEFCREEVAP